MAQKGELTAAGLAAEPARMLGQDAVATPTPTGTVQADAAALTSSFNITATAASNTGVILPSATGATEYVIYNGSGNTIKVWPAVGEYINAAQDTAFSITSAKSCILVPSGIRWIANLSA